MRNVSCLRVVVFLSIASIWGGVASAQELKINVPYVCKSGTQMRVTNCDSQRVQACDLESLTNGKWQAFIHASKPTIANAIRNCMGPDAPNAPAAPPPVRPGPTTAVQQPAASGSSAGPSDTTDPGTLAARKCAASGRPLSDCFAEAVGDALPGFIPALESKRPVPGVRLAGIYRAPKVSLAIVNDPATGLHTAAVLKCGKLEPITRPIKLSAGGVLPLADLKKTITLTFRPDGVLVGPKDVLVDGQVVVGYGAARNETVVVQDAPVAVQRSIGTPINTSDSSTFYYQYPSHTETRSVQPPIFGPATDRCDFSNVVLTQDRAAMPTGLSMLGDYRGSGGFSATFRTDTVTVNCGESQVADRYRVEANGKQMVVRFQNGGNPFAMTVQSTGALAPSTPGVVTVAGRVMTGMNGAQPIYAPRTARCQLTTLTPVAP